MGADLGRDGEARRDREADPAHLSEAGPLAAEKLAHAGLAVRLAAAEGVNRPAHALALDLREIGHPAESRANPREQLEAVLPERLVAAIDRDLVEEGVDRRPEACQGCHGGGEVLAPERDADLAARTDEPLEERLLGRLAEQRLGNAAVVARLVLRLLDAHDVGGALVGGQEIGAILAPEEGAKRLDAREQAHEIVLCARGEDRGDEIVPHALLAQMHLEAVGEEGEEIFRRIGSEAGKWATHGAACTKTNNALLVILRFRGAKDGRQRYPQPILENDANDS